MESNGFSYRRSGTAGCEIINPDGQVFAWAVDECWAVLIVALLNQKEGK
jgi:hypothetical protein